MPKAKKLPSGSYRTQVYAGKDATGKPRYESFTAPTAKESELLAAQFKASNRQRQTDKTVKEAIEGYIKAKEAVLSPATIKAYKSQAANHYESIGKISIRKITTEDVQVYISSLVGEVSSKTIANIYGLLSSALALYAPDLHLSITLPKRVKKRQNAPSDDEIRLLFQSADTTMKICIALAAFGSCRRGEICALKYKDITGDILFVHSDMVQGPDKVWKLKEMPKTAESVRNVRLPHEIMTLIGDGKPEDFIIPFTPNIITNRFIRLRDSLGLPDIRFHDLRHYFASTAAVLNIPQNYIADFGGWRKDSPVMREVYQNKIIPIAEQYSNKLAKHFTGVMDM